jgi:hypothetical protein
MFKNEPLSVNNYSLKNFKTLPYNGWIKVCSNKKCKTITSRYYLLKYDNKTYKLYFCKKCLKNDKDNIEKYIINNYLNYLYN